MLKDKILKSAIDQHNNFHCLNCAKCNITFHGHPTTRPFEKSSTYLGSYTINKPSVAVTFIESYTLGWVDWISFTTDLSAGTRWPSTSAARTPCSWSGAAPSRRASRRTLCRAKHTRWADAGSIFETWQIFSPAPGGGEDGVGVGGLVAGDR